MRRSEIPQQPQINVKYRSTGAVFAAQTRLFLMR